MSSINLTAPVNSSKSLISSLWKIPRSVGWILLISFLLKLSLIRLNLGEYTDGIIQLQLWESPVVFFPPGYSAFAWMIHACGVELLLAGRLVSFLASVFTLLFFYQLSLLVLEDDQEAFWATLFLALSPIFNRWSIRVMTDSLFCFFFIACMREFFLSLKYGRSSLSLLAWTGAASLVRYQGLFFIPLFFFLLWKRRSFLTARFSIHQTGLFLLALLTWGLLAFWIVFRGFGHHEQFIERGSQGFWITLSAYYSMFETYILYWPWAVTYGLFFLGVIGMASKSHWNSIYREFLLLFAFTAVVFLVVQSAFLSFQYRYLLPLVPLWCILSARGWSVVRIWLPSRPAQEGLMVVVILNLLLMTGAVLYLQRATFGDLTKSAEALKVVGRGARVVSDEVYRNGVYNVKMRFWSGREMEYYPMTELKEGDIVVLHNTYSELNREAEKIQSQFDFSVIGRWQSENLFGDYTTLPLLPDIMVFPQGVPLTSNPPCMVFRFVPQFYYSVMLRIEKKKT